MKPPLDLIIREASPQDEEALAPLVISRWGEIVVSRGRVHTLRALPALIALRDGVIVGCLKYRHHDGATEVITLDAQPERRGIGTALMLALKERGGRIWLITTNDNLPAQSFYAKLGMKLVAVHHDAIAISRRLKPEIPLFGFGGVPIKDELEYEG